MEPAEGFHILSDNGLFYSVIFYSTRLIRHGKIIYVDLDKFSAVITVENMFKRILRFLGEHDITPLIIKKRQD